MKSQKDLLQSQGSSPSTEENQNNSHSSKRISEVSYTLVKGTPFIIIEQEKGKGFEICVGQEIVWPDKIKTIRKAKKIIKEKPWTLILATIYTSGKIWNEDLKAKQNGN